MNFRVESIQSKTSEMIIAMVYVENTQKEVKMIITNGLNGYLDMIMYDKPEGMVSIPDPATATKMDLNDVVVGTVIEVGDGSTPGYILHP